MRPLRHAVVAALAASLSLGPAAPALSASPGKAAVDVRVGSGPGFTRIEFQGAQPLAARRDGDSVVLRFGAIQTPDIARLRVDPPRYLKTASVKPVKGGVELRLALGDGVDARLGKADGSAYVNLGPAPAAPAPAPPPAKPDARPDPTPAGGVVKMTAALDGRSLLLRFPWRAPLGAAVFRRGEAVWMVFDAKARLDLSEAPHGLAQMRKMQAVSGDGFTAVRIVVPPATLASARAEGGTWTLALGPAVTEPATPVRLGREDAAGPAVLTAQVAGTTGVFWVQDPVVGDRLAVVTALAPAKGLVDPRRFVDAQLLASTQGLAVRPVADDLQVSADGDVVRIGRPEGLALSPASTPLRTAAAPADLPVPAALPALIDFQGWSKTGPGGFTARYDALLDAAAQETAKGKAGGVQARLGLARFLIGTELAPEAIGVLNMIAKAQPVMMNDPEFRGLRGAARAMAGRYKDAQADFSSPALAEDPASSLWRGYVAAKLGDDAGAREQFAAGASALAQFAPKWRARFAVAHVDAALGAGDLGGARAALAAAQSVTLPPAEADATTLAAAKVADALGRTDQALGLYDAVSKASYGALSAPALLRATEIRLDRGQMPAKDAVAILDSLRYRWRGDATELETVRALGRIYLDQGRYREALDAMRSAGQRLTDTPAAIGLQADLAKAFKGLFLEGGADGLQPIQALALFYDFKEFTPIGAEGDLMVRRLARRLVDVDLLDQAAELLKYQADNRLDGAPRAEVSTDLATIQLMNRKPEQALQAINGSRTTLLPKALVAERRIIEARAWTQLGQYDHALEILGKDKASEAADIRADIAWKQRDWALAGKLLEARLGDRWKKDGPLAPEDETRLLRAGAAYSLVGDDAALARLRGRFGKMTERARAPEAMRVALSGTGPEAAKATDFARAVSDADTFAGWVQRMKQRFRDRAAGETAPEAGKAAVRAEAAPAGPKASPKAVQG